MVSSSATRVLDPEDPPEADFEPSSDFGLPSDADDGRALRFMAGVFKNGDFSNMATISGASSLGINIG